MELTVADIYRFPELRTMNLIAGKDGLDKKVGACGILDYEFDSEVSDKYYEFNYRQEDFMTLTSFLYARDNEFLILEAVKKLVAKGGSGLIIKNVFNLPIHENVIKYADHMKFPIFVMQDKSMLFEDIIILIAKLVEHYRSLDYRADRADLILENIDNEDQVERWAHDINMSLKDDLFSIYFRCKETFKEEEYLEYEDLFLENKLLSTRDSLFYYKNGMMLIYSDDMFRRGYVDEKLNEVLTALGDKKSHFQIGVSCVYHFIKDIGYALREAVEAAVLHENACTPYKLYEDLGLYKILMQYANDPVMKRFSSDFISKLNAFDAENNGHLLSTAVAYIKTDGDIPETGRLMNQHPNTIRNRLGKVNNILGLNVMSYPGYEQLSVAIKLYLCQQLS